MQLTAKKIRCPLCGAKNDPDALRCQICTRPLETKSRSTTEAIYQEALWSRSVSNPNSSRPGVVPVLAVLLIAAVALNYFLLGFGPNWAHLDSARPGSTWLQVEDPSYRVDLPGTPAKYSAVTPVGTFSTRWVWVDGNWQTLRDANTTSADALKTATQDFYAGIIVGSGPALTDPRSQSASLVASIQPGVTVEALTTTELQKPAYGIQYDVEGTFRLWPDRSTSGDVRARVIQFNGATFVAVMFFNEGVSNDLKERLLSEFVPAGAPGFDKAG